MAKNKKKYLSLNIKLILVSNFLIKNFKISWTKRKKPVPRPRSSKTSPSPRWRSSRGGSAPAGWGVPFRGFPKVWGFKLIAYKIIYTLF